jgi:hypothetical protein
MRSCGIILAIESFSDKTRAAVFHRPHPRPETKKGAVDAVRQFLINAGVKP